MFSIRFLYCFVVLCLNRFESKRIEDSSLDFNEIAYHAEPSQIFLGSPSIIRLSTGRLVASHDFFGSGYGSQPRNTSVYVSDDNGETWTFTSYIKHSYYATLTVYNNMIYALGIDNDVNANIIIHRSSDNGVTWIYNGNDEGVILFKGSYFTSPVPVVMANGILYRAIELDTGHGYEATIISCDLSKFHEITEDDPLMSANNWRMATPLAFNKEWIPKSLSNITAPAFSNGNVVILPKAGSSDPTQIRILNVLRFYCAPIGNLAIILELNPTTNTFSFVSIIPFPGGLLRFTIRYDPVTETYFALANPLTQHVFLDQRNVLSVTYTKDLVNLTDWKVLVERLLYDDTGFTANDSLRYTGFHFVDWQYDHGLSTSNKSTCIEWNCDGGEDIIFVTRTAYRGANSYHNSNRITYKVLKNYRQLLQKHEQTFH